MDSHSTGLIIALIVLIVLSAYFSATETAFSSLNRIRLKNLADNGNKRAKLAYKLVDNYDELISSVLVGNNIVNISASSLATVLFIKAFGDNGPTVSTIAMTIIVLIFGEVTPKSISKEAPEAFAMFSAPIINVLIYVFKPINVCLVGIKKLVKKFVKVSNDRTISESELLTIVEEAEHDGGINENESELIHNVIEFDDLEAIDIMTPRVDVEAVDKTSTVQEIADLFTETGFSRLPVYEETIDSIVGIINEKDFHNLVLRDGNAVKQIIKPVEFIPPSMKISALLKLLQQNKSHLAVIVDEFGGTEGIVTLEDIIEELVGEIWDEHDEVTEFLHKQPDGSYNIDCTTDLDDMYDLFEIKGECEASTVSGWVLEQIDRIPKQGDHFIAEGLEVTVTAVDNRRVMEINVKPVPQETAESDDE